MPRSFLATDNWWDLRDLSNLSGAILDALDKIAPQGVVYVAAPIIGFIGAFALFTLLSQLFIGVLGERKIIGRIQSRYGPNRVGPYGVLQPIADALKLLTKEALTPSTADRLIMYSAPVVFVMPAILVWAVIPFGPNMIIADIPISLVYYLAVTSIPVLVTFMAGWSQDNKDSLFGSMRVVAMAISYEVPLVVSLLAIVVLTETLSLKEMVLWQDTYNIWLLLVQPLVLIIFFICASAELNRTPTDIAEAESEIVAGYLTEYSGMKWGLFYGMDIGYALAASAFAATVFFGGWTLFGLEEWVPPWIIFILKVWAFYFLFIWTRGTLPRLRIDQLMAFSWKYMLPIALVNLLVVCTERILWTDAFDGDKPFVYLFAIVNIALAIALVVGWARFVGYRPERTPSRPRLVREAGGYIPVSSVSGEGR